MAYFVGIFEKVCYLNESLQVPQINALTQNDEFNAVIQNLQLCRTNIKRNIFYMFATFKKCLPSSETY
jgi:hypothetical protein